MLPRATSEYVQVNGKEQKKREEMAKVYPEINSLLVPSIIPKVAGQQSFRSKPEKMKYAFEHVNVPREETEYLKVEYLARHGVPSVTQCQGSTCTSLTRLLTDLLTDLLTHSLTPLLTGLLTGLLTYLLTLLTHFTYSLTYFLPLGGTYYERIFNATSSPLEQFILDRNFMGPCWIKIKHPRSMDTNISWCKIELAVEDPVCVTIINEKRDPPPATTLCISMKTAVNPSTHVHEIISIAGLVHKEVSMDSESRPDIG